MGFFVAAAMCDEIDAYGFSTYDMEGVSFDQPYTHDDGLNVGGEVVDNMFALQFTFNALLGCLNLVKFHP